MIYLAYQAHADLMARARAMATAGKPLVEVEHRGHLHPNAVLRRWTAACEMLRLARLTHGRPSFNLPSVKIGEEEVAITEYLTELKPKAGLIPKEKIARAHCRSICGEMHSGFSNLRSALPMNIKSRHPGFKVWAGAQADIDRVLAIWRECLKDYGGPFLMGAKPTAADAMYAPVCTRFVTYDVKLDAKCAAYRDRVLALPAMAEWIKAARTEPDEVEELDVEF